MPRPAADREQTGWRLRVTPGADELPRAEADDDTLVQASRAGNREAFDVLVQRHQRLVYQICYRFAGAHEDASDLAQDVFVRAYRGLSGFKGSAAFSTWLYRIAVNVCLNRAAVHTTARVPLDDSQADVGIEAADATLLRAERAAEVRAAVAQLPPRQRATLILRVYHELPHAQVAAILGTSVGTAKGNLFHALANLKKRLEKRS